MWIMEYVKSISLRQYPDSADRSLSLYKSLLSRWFYVPAGSQYLAKKPKMLSSAKGFWLRGRFVHSMLSTSDEYQMWATDADAILADFVFVPGEKRLERLFSIIKKPVIISVRFVYNKKKLPTLAKKFETSGAAGFYVPRMLPNKVLEETCSACTIPVFAASGPDVEEVKSKIEAGVFAVCIPGKDVSKELEISLHRLFPDITVIASCNRSEKLMQRSEESGIDAVIFKPCIPLELDWENNY
jgi:hypothetical protein